MSSDDMESSSDGETQQGAMVVCICDRLISSQYVVELIGVSKTS